MIIAIHIEDGKTANEKDRSYGSMMMERLTGAPDGRIDHVLQVIKFLLYIRVSQNTGPLAHSHTPTPSYNPDFTVLWRPGLHVGVVTDHGSSGLFIIQLGPYTFLIQYCIRLEPGPFRASPLDYRSQISRPSTTPCTTRTTNSSFDKIMTNYWTVVL